MRRAGCLPGYRSSVYLELVGRIDVSWHAHRGRAEDGLLEGTEHRRTIHQKGEHHELVATGLQPHAGYIEGALRADAPGTSQCVAIEPDEALAQALRVQEGVRGGTAGHRRIERRPIEARRMLAGRCGVVQRRAVAERKRVILPVLQRLAVEAHAAENALALVQHLLAKVDAAVV